MECTGPEVGWLYSIHLVFTHSSALLCPGLWRQSAHNPDGVRERQTNKHQNNVTGTMAGPNGELLLMGQGGEVNAAQNIPLWSRGAVASIYEQLCVRSAQAWFDALLTPMFVLFCVLIENKHLLDIDYVAGTGKAFCII